LRGSDNPRDRIAEPTLRIYYGMMVPNESVLALVRFSSAARR